MARGWIDDERLAHMNKKVLAEVKRVGSTFGPMLSRHDGYAVVLEELDEVWDEIKANKHKDAHDEMVQVTAMALRYLHDLHSDTDECIFPVSVG